MKKQNLMRKKFLAVALTTSVVLTGCGKDTTKETKETNQTVATDTVETADSLVSTEAAETEATEEETIELIDYSEYTIRLGGLKGPTTMGMAKLLNDASNNETRINYEYTLATAADELTPMLVQGNLDIAAVPSNLASILYANTEGAVEVLAVNTLGVTYIVDTADSIQSIEDLKGKTILATGMGSVPEYTLKYVLEMNGIDPENDVTLEFKSEPTEIVSIMASSEEEVIAMLPQPFVTVAATQVEGLRVALSINDEWNALNTGSALVTGVLVVRKEFAEENADLLQAFLEEYEASVTYVNENPTEASVMIGDLDIVKAPIAEKAIPNCNMTCVSGEEMKDLLTGFYEVLFEKNPLSVGGSLPEEDFYYLSK